MESSHNFAGEIIIIIINNNNNNKISNSNSSKHICFDELNSFILQVDYKRLLKNLQSSDVENGNYMFKSLNKKTIMNDLFYCISFVIYLFIYLFIKLFVCLFFVLFFVLR